MKKVINEHKFPLLFLLITFGTYFILLFSRIITENKTGFYLGHEHVWSDWPLHIAITSTFAFKPMNTWFAYHPMYAGGKSTYPFLTDFISGMLMRIGFPLPLAIIIPSIIFSLLLIIGMYILLLQLFKSKKIAVISISIFFLSSGPGFINFINAFFAHPTLQMLLYPPVHYTRINQYDWYSGNAIVGFLLPQRAFLLGMTIGIWVMAGLAWILQKSQHIKRTKIILAALGLMAGLLSIVHIHSFIVIVIVTGFMCFISLRRWKLLLFYILPAAILSLIFYLIFIAGGIQIDNFVKWLPGWTANNSIVGWAAMWISLWGLTLPVSVVGLFFVRQEKILSKSWIAGFITVFIVGNLILFQPILWDNAKFFMWSYFAFSTLCAIVLSWLSRKAFAGTFIAVVIFLGLTLTGVLELTRLQAINRNQLQLSPADDINLGIQVRNATNPLSVFLTDTSTNHFVMVWGGRSIVMGFKPWVVNFGFSDTKRSRDMGTMFSGGNLSLPLLKQYKISYVVIGPGEKYGFKANELFYEKNFPVAFANQSYRIYDVRSATRGL
ncbi:MAG: hypothetical protein US48_C0001G0021 [Candidatus Levybacteria bacterium GW2011_GWA2_37_36]|nr:MAG: hypothetical protein US33_C0009G0002 [Parcubacteria group bacterium GW2011_GWC1_36_9]KKQ29678.1 MAG: hypothetical protein US43_C0004G0022 [Candidatus Levybacteria bacterium GW2011_GWA1_37_16]KKQ34117.1 MAG: hypothetical protein US48_C0001G0021 [Candidatus Levybacteria bacterium GW2011_GWA2_37_36]KKQ38452.1 MAG: hypothetical protein US55_C0006G0007 [Candidatus Levybacteria bacterium GW2011_GWC2_37_7]KKQ42979.1 MAG: hypothetical protein US59_C0001G0021 [Candidatus Levybacteria bacterium G